eukprot:COSAG04_NODE_5063_length_1759_cov_11.585542_1_plen_28_part_10
MAAGGAQEYGRGTPFDAAAERGLGKHVI